MIIIPNGFWIVSCCENESKSFTANTNAGKKTIEIDSREGERDRDRACVQKY